MRRGAELFLLSRGRHSKAYRVGARLVRCLSLVKFLMIISKTLAAIEKFVIEGIEGSCCTIKGPMAAVVHQLMRADRLHGRQVLLIRNMRTKTSVFKLRAVCREKSVHDWTITKEGAKLSRAINLEIN